MYFVVKAVISIFHPPSSIRYLRAVHFRKITIIGVGLLGGSIGLAVKRRKLARQTAGFVRRAASLKDCERAGAVDFATTDLLAAVWDADLVILCTPLAQMRSRVREMLPGLETRRDCHRRRQRQGQRRARTGIADCKIRRAFCRQPSDGRRGKNRRGRRARGFVRQHRLRGHADEKNKPGGAEKSRTVLEGASVRACWN